MSSVPASTIQKAAEYVARRYKKSSEEGVFLQFIYDEANTVSVKADDEGNPLVTFKVHTREMLRNSMRMVHGGASSSLIAIFSVLSLAASPKYYKDVNNPTDAELEAFANDLGITRTMNSQIIQAVPLNADIFVKCHVLSNTKSNAYVTGSIVNSAGKILVYGVHDMMKRSPGSPEKDSPLDLHAHYTVPSRL